MRVCSKQGLNLSETGLVSTIVISKYGLEAILEALETL